MRALPSPSLLTLCLCLCLAACSSTSAADSAADAAADTAADAAADSAADAAADAAADSAPDSAPDSADVGPCDGAPTWSTLQRLPPAAVDALIKAEHPIVIDVHTPYEGSLPGTAAHIVYTDVDAIEAFLGRDKCANVVLTCLGGPMSVSAGNALVARGYLRVRDLLGGMNAWEAAGYTLDR